jgi:alcohol dehydrogenase class IV
MAEAMGLADKSFEGFYNAVCDMLDRLDIPQTLSEIGVPADCAPAVAVKAKLDSAALTNPRPSTIAEIQTIIENALKKGR